MNWRAYCQRSMGKKNKEVGLSHRLTLTDGRREESSAGERRKCRFQPNTHVLSSICISAERHLSADNGLTVQRESAGAFLDEV